MAHFVPFKFISIKFGIQFFTVLLQIKENSQYLMSFYHLTHFENCHYTNYICKQIKKLISIKPNFFQHD